MKMKFNEWSIGGKIIATASILGILSLFFKWVDLGFVSVSGFQQQGYIFLLLYIYPVYVLLNDKTMNKKIAIPMSVTAVFFGVVYIFYKSFDFLGTTVYAASSGVYLYIISSILLTIGIYKYDK